MDAIDHSSSDKDFRVPFPPDPMGIGDPLLAVGCAIRIPHSGLTALRRCGTFPSAFHCRSKSVSG